MARHDSRRGGRRFLLWGALSGIASGLVFLGVAEAVAFFVSPTASPILAVGSFVIDVVPQPIKELAISTFGDADKVALLAGLGLAVAIASALGGVLQLVRPPLGVAVVLLAGALATAAAVTRTGGAALAFLPTVLGALAGAALLLVLGRRLRGWRDGARTGAGAERASRTAAVDRRQFLVITAVSSVVAVAAGVGARLASAATSSIEAIRDALRLPTPGSTVTIPDGAELDIPGLSPLFTPNADFYRVDTALTVPAVDPSSWRLVIDGMVDQRVELSFQDLVDMGVDEYVITLTCVSNQVGGGLVGNATWLGVPIRDVLAMAGVQSGADMVLSESVDGYTASTPLASLTDDSLDAILAIGMNGEPLPLEHGFPVRMVVPGLYGYVSATKWVTRLKVTTFAQDEAYWTPRGYSAQAPIKLSSRVDTPRSDTPIDAGTVAIAGMAWAQTVGIEKVEVQIDNGDWQQATLSTAVNDDTWVQWYLEWDATPGTHYIAVRATDKAGMLQVEERAPIAPDGSTGWQRPLVTVRG
ncbi:molybdopterin-dependent oxidoreductase [Agrococcus sp. SGAir0287]|uniref:molybdopterin-dependent oxidoreductase n=1 Tax=Agrococcus sp. SGAir0287 TaxID=2070347 RepID=UPI0010CD5819|nr:molybdopterin-dependent oxidoreductase [Agrococcus sp. SGAir0287]QCR20693.1 oxidoreductase [Agrococcus sp. SGAir0287]